MNVGKVLRLWRFPVKSMAGESLTEADLTWSGLAGDRKWAFVRPGQQRNGFPWLTIRQQPVMHHYRPELVDPEAPDRSLVQVVTPAGATLDIAVWGPWVYRAEATEVVVDPKDLPDDAPAGRPGRSASRRAGPRPPPAPAR